MTTNVSYTTPRGDVQKLEVSEAIEWVAQNVNATQGDQFVVMTQKAGGKVAIKAGSVVTITAD